MDHNGIKISTGPLPDAVVNIVLDQNTEALSVVTNVTNRFVLIGMISAALKAMQDKHFSTPQTSNLAIMPPGAITRIKP